MAKYILTELLIGLAIMILVPVMLMVGDAMNHKFMEKDAERAGYTGYLVSFSGYLETDDGVLTCWEVEDSGKWFCIDKRTFRRSRDANIYDPCKVYVMENSVEENMTADGNGSTYTVYRDCYGIWRAQPLYYVSVIIGILIDLAIVLPVTLVVLVIMVIVYKIRNRSGSTI